jgi:hypothetical protein
MKKFELESYRIKDMENKVELKTYALSFELYQIVCVDLSNGIERNVGGRIIGLENVERRFQQAIESLSGAYVFEDEE